MFDREEMLQWQVDREAADRKWQSQQQIRLAVIAGIFLVLGVGIVFIINGVARLI